MTPTTAGHPRSEEGSGRQPAGPDAAGSLSADELFHLLRNSRRRAVIRYLRGQEGPVLMRDIAEQLAAWEHDTTVAQLTSTERKRVYVALYQVHLPPLADAGLIAYNKPRGIIEPQPLLDDIAVYLDTVQTASTDADGGLWPLGYLGVSLGSTLLLLGIALDLPVFEPVSARAATVLILLLFAALTVAKLIVDGGRTP